MPGRREVVDLTTGTIDVGVAAGSAGQAPGRLTRAVPAPAAAAATALSARAAVNSRLAPDPVLALAAAPSSLPPFMSTSTSTSTSSSSSCASSSSSSSASSASFSLSLSPSPSSSSSSSSLVSDEDDPLAKALEASLREAEASAQAKAQVEREEYEQFRRAVAESVAAAPSSSSSSAISSQEAEAIDNSLLSNKVEKRKRLLHEIYHEITQNKINSTNSIEAEPYLHEICDCPAAALGSTLSVPKDVTARLMDLLFLSWGGRFVYEKDKGVDNDGTVGASASSSTNQDKAQYGSIYPDLAHAIFERGQLEKGELFIDIGSGLGQVVVQAPLYCPGAVGVGLELMVQRHTHALTLEAKMRRVREYVKLSREDPDNSTTQAGEHEPYLTMMLCGSFVGNTRIPFIHHDFQVSHEEYAQLREPVVRLLNAGRSAGDCGDGSSSSSSTTTSTDDIEGITPSELFSVGDLFFLNNALGTMSGRNSGDLMGHIARLMRHMKIGARMITVDQVLSLDTNCWGEDVRNAEDPTDEGCWMKEEKVSLYGAYSWNSGVPRDQTLWLYTKVRDKWTCNGCTFAHNNVISHLVCSTCSGDPHQKPPEQRKSKRARKRQRLE